MDENNVIGEVIVADNGSSDGSQVIAAEAGARVVHAAPRGYGVALKEGINAAGGEYIIMGDADDSYDFANLDCFITKLRAGYDLVMGNRFRGGIRPGAMPALNRYFGIPALSILGRVVYGNPPCRDFHCGLRGFRRDAAERMRLQCRGMEFATEMIAKAATLRMKIVEVPTTLSPAGRQRPPHLRRWRDGLRHVRFMLLHRLSGMRTR